jgi:hypothetical protein
MPTPLVSWSHDHVVQPVRGVIDGAPSAVGERAGVADPLTPALPQLFAAWASTGEATKSTTVVATSGSRSNR